MPRAARFTQAAVRRAVKGVVAAGETTQHQWDTRKMENETPSNVVARIRFAADRYVDHACADFLLMAIDEIERLRARVVELEEAAKGAVVVANIASSRIRELEAALVKIRDAVKQWPTLVCSQEEAEEAGGETHDA